MTRSLGLALTLVLVLAGLGVAAAAVYNATHNGDAHLTASLGGAAATLITSVSLLWAPRPGGLDAMAREAERDFAAAPPASPSDLTATRWAWRSLQGSHMRSTASPTWDARPSRSHQACRLPSSGRRSCMSACTPC